MATTQAIPVVGNGQAQMARPDGAGENGNRQALVPVQPTLDPAESVAFRGPVARLPVELDVAVPVRDFRVRNLLALAPGQLIESRWGNGDDVPLASGEVQLAWSEFEVIETQISVRITRLA